jgi:nicotinamide riboside kinase
VIRVVVTGSECTGKTTMAGALAIHYATVWVPEYVRQFVEEVRRPPGPADIDRIARGQIALEERLSSEASEVLVLDTDLLSTLVYSRHYFGSCPSWIEDAVRRRAGNLYLLAGIDVPWFPDGDQRDRGDRREEMHDLFLRALLTREMPFLEIRGPHEVRLQNAIAAIDRRLEMRD